MCPKRLPSSSTAASTSRHAEPLAWAHTAARSPLPPGPVSVTHTRSPPRAWATPQSDVQPGSARVAHPGPIGRVIGVTGGCRTAPALETIGAGGFVVVVTDTAAVVAVVSTGASATVVVDDASPSDVVVAPGSVVPALAT